MRSIPDVPAGILAQCQAEQNPSNPDKPALSQCVSLLEQQGAQHQQTLTLSHLLQYSLITLAVVLALAAILGWIFAGRVLRPVQQITMAARAASEHNLSARVALRGPRDELRELAQTFDDMLGRLQAAFEGQQRFMANASHELRTPLAVMRATIDVVLGNPDSTPDDLRGMAVDIRAAVDHAEHLIGALLLLARNERGLTRREDVDLATTAEDALDSADVGDCRVHATLEPAVISGDPVLSDTPRREPGRQRRPLQRPRRRHLDQHPQHCRRHPADHRQYRAGYRRVGGRPHLPAVRAAQRSHVPRRLRPRPRHRRIHRRGPRRHGRRPPPRWRRTLRHGHDSSARARPISAAHPTSLPESSQAGNGRNLHHGDAGRRMA